MKYPPALLMLSLSFSSISALGQTTFGLKAGLNVADIVMTNYIDPDVESEFGLKAGIHGGFFVHGMTDDGWGFAGELLYSNKGTRANDNINLHYIAVPLLFQYRLSERVFAELGPEVSYLISADSEHGNAVNSYNNKLDLGLDGGFRLDASRFILGIRYCAGLLSVRNAESISVPGQDKVKYQNRVLQVFLSYKMFTLE